MHLLELLALPRYSGFPFAFVAYAIGKKSLTVSMVAIFAVCEAISVVIFYLFVL